MASGDEVYSATAMRVVTAEANPAQQTWSVSLDAETLPDQVVTILAHVSAPTNAPFDVEKTYDITIVEH